MGFLAVILGIFISEYSRARQEGPVMQIAGAILLILGLAMMFGAVVSEAVYQGVGAWHL